MTTNITATELSKNLSDVLNRVRYQDEQFLVERNGEPVAHLSSPGSSRGATLEELIAAVGDLFPIGDGFADDLEAAQADQGMAEFPEWPS